MVVTRGEAANVLIPYSDYDIGNSYTYKIEGCSDEEFTPTSIEEINCGYILLVFTVGCDDVMSGDYELQVFEDEVEIYTRKLRVND